MIDTILAKKIVEIISLLLDRNINIMNEEGIIIASNQTDRIGTLHSLALECIEKREVISLNQFETHKYIGSLPGVNLPIFHNEKVIGVVGISGNPTEVYGYGGVVKGMVEHLISERIRNKFEIDYNENKRNLFVEIFNMKITDDYTDVKQRAKKLDIRYKDVYLAITNTYDSKVASVDLVRYLNDNLGFTFYLFDGKCISVIEKDRFNIEKVKEVNAKINKKFKVKSRLFYSIKVNTIEELSIQYNMIRLFTDFKNTSVIPRNIVSSNDMLELYIVNNMRTKTKANYLMFYKQIFEDKKLSEELLLTIKTYFESEMNKEIAAKALHVHKNTINYRLNKFKEKYNVDIFNPLECSRLYMAILCYLSLE